MAPVQNLKSISSELTKVHIIGVCGTLMGAFASFLKREGIAVSGSDQNIYPPMSDVLQAAGVKMLSGYSADNLAKVRQELGGNPDLVVIGNVISRDNPEARAVIDGGLPYTSLPEAMERFLLVQSRNLVVAGTHGKTTTSSMLAHVLRACGRDPSYFIGGVSKDLPHSFHVASGKLGALQGGVFVLEGDEYDTAFWDKVPKFNHYLPNDVILTSVEYDHADIYPDFAAVVRAFSGLMGRIRPDGRLIACFDDSTIRDLAKQAKVPVLSYGSRTDSGARFIVADLETSGDGARFKIIENGELTAHLRMPVSGLHNALNATAVWIECRELGIPANDVAKALGSFQGVKRRQEERGEINGVLVIDDFAHHPTAVRETLRGLKAKYAGRKMIAVFEPRSATSRRKVFQQDYVDAFTEADEVYISQPYDQTKIAATDQFSSQQLVDELVQRKTAAHLFQSVEGGVAQVAQGARRGDVIAVLSNGGFGGFIPMLLKALG